MQKKELEWYCIEWDMNAKKPYLVNVMRYISLDDLKKKLKYKGTRPNKYNSVKNYEELRDYLRSEFMYRFWSKCEHEIIISPWPSGKEPEEVKIDVFDQIFPNIDRITEYVVRELKLDFKSDGTKLERYSKFLT